MLNALLLVLLGYAYALLGFVALAWTADRSPWVMGALRDQSEFLNSLTLFYCMAIWPLVWLFALPGIVSRARARRRQAI